MEYRKQVKIEKTKMGSARRRLQSALVVARRLSGTERSSVAPRRWKTGSGVEHVLVCDVDADAGRCAGGGAEVARVVVTGASVAGNLAGPVPA